MTTYLPPFDQITDAQLVDMDPRRWSRNLHEQLKKRIQQEQDYAEAKREPPAAARAFFVGARTWLEYRAVLPDRYQVTGLGVARPGVRASADMAASHRRGGWLDTRAGSMTAGAGVGGGLGVLGSTLGLHAVAGVALAASAGLAIVGAGAGRVVDHRRNRLCRDSRLVEVHDDHWSTLIGIAATAAQIRIAIATFDRQMAEAYRRDRLAPLTLDLPVDLHHRTHRALWDAVTDTSLDDAGEIAAALSELAATVDARIDEAWATRASSRVADLDSPLAGPDEPVQPLRATTHDLADITRSVTETTEAARHARRDIEQLNGQARDEA